MPQGRRSIIASLGFSYRDALLIGHVQEDKEKGVRRGTAGGEGRESAGPATCDFFKRTVWGWGGGGGGGGGVGGGGGGGGGVGVGGGCGGWVVWGGGGWVGGGLVGL